MTFHHIIWPEDRVVSEAFLIAWARDDIANGASSVADDPSEIVTIEDALTVFEDSGTLTLARD